MAQDKDEIRHGGYRYVKVDPNNWLGVQDGQLRILDSVMNATLFDQYSISILESIEGHKGYYITEKSIESIIDTIRSEINQMKADLSNLEQQIEEKKEIITFLTRKSNGE